MTQPDGLKVARRFSNVQPIWKFCFLSFISLGLYDIAWSHKHWKFFKERGNLKINPWLVSLFASFSMYWLAKRIFTIAEDKGYRKKPSAAGVAFPYLLINALWRLPDPFWLISNFSFIALLPALKAINYYWEQEQPDLPVRNSFTTREIVWSVLGGVFWSLVLISLFMPSDKSDNLASLNSKDVEPSSTEQRKKLSPSWNKYVSREGSYTVKFPGTPEEQNQAVDTPIGKVNFVTVSYSDNLNKRVYYSTNAQYHVDPSRYNVEAGLDGARDNISQSSKLTVVSEKKISLYQLPGREIVMQGESGAMLIQLLIDPSGPTMYETFVLAEDGNLGFPEARSFLDSFTVSESNK